MTTFANAICAARGIFVTGTDTGVGKTVVAVALLRSLAATGLRVSGMKPVSAGIDPGENINADVAALIGASNVPLPLADVNPYAFASPIAPHIAAQRAGVLIDVGRIDDAYARIARHVDAIVVEGAGGVLVPLSRHSDMLDIPARLALPVLLVVGVRLGCLNHSLLSALAIDSRGLRLAGWIANRIDPAMAEGDACVSALADRLQAPLVADLAWHAEGAPPIGLDRTSLWMLGFAGEG